MNAQEESAPSETDGAPGENPTVNQPAEPRKARLTLYKGARRPKPAREDDLTWPEVVEGLRELIVKEPPEPILREDGSRDLDEEKVNLLAFAPHRLRVPHRGEENVDAVTLLAIDIDRGELAPLLHRIKERGIAAVVYGSPSDDPSGDPCTRRLRVVAPISRDIQPTECKATRLAFAEWLGIGPGQGVEGAHEAARLLFVGRLYGAPAREFYAIEGEPVDVDRLPTTTLDWSTKPSQPRANDAQEPREPNAHADCKSGAKVRAFDAILGLLGDPRNWDGRKHHLCFALGGVMRHGNWPRDECGLFVRTWLSKHLDLDSAAVEKGVRDACQAWSRDGVINKIAGKEKLDEIVGRPLGDAIQAAVLLPWRAQPHDAEAQPSEAQPAPFDDSDRGWGVLSPTPTPRSYLISELELGVGRAGGWIGETGASKTLSLEQLEIDLSLGRRPFGRFTGPGKPVKVLRISWEAFGKIEHDYLRLLRGAGVDVDWAEINKRLRFYDPRRDGYFLGVNSAHNREWLMRLIAPFAGGLAVIDPLVAACAGLDENSTEISAPIYDLEYVSRETDVTIIVAHHQGYSSKGRSRGSSAIDGAFDSTFVISKGETPNVRTVTQRKTYRYGVRPFDLVIQDVNADGTGWAPTEVTAGRGECSWGVRVVARDAGREEDAKQRANRGQNNAKGAGKAASVQAAGAAILLGLRAHPSVSITRKELEALGGGTRNANAEARARLTVNGLVELRGIGQYGITQLGLSADPTTVARALGKTGDFDR